MWMLFFFYFYVDNIKLECGYYVMYYGVIGERYKGGRKLDNWRRFVFSVNFRSL